MTGAMAQQANRRKSMLRELENLSVEEQNVRDYADTMNRAPGRTGPAYSGYTSERSYLDGLNRQGRIADLTSKVGGGTGMKLRAFQRGGGGGSMGALAAAANPEADFATAWNMQTDPMERDYNLAALRRVETQNRALDEEATLRDKFQNPYHRQQLGDLERSEMVRDAGAMGDAATTRFNAETPMRSMKRFEERSRAADLGYFDPAVEKARLESEARIRDYQSNKERSRSAAMGAFGKLAEQAAALEPEIVSDQDDPNTGVNLGMFGRWGAKKLRKPNPAFEAIQRSMDDLRSQFAGEDTGAGEGGQELSLDDVAEVAAQQGWTIEEAIKEAESRGYSVR